jgi:SAM-dependent methyltransferase
VLHPLDAEAVARRYRDRIARFGPTFASLNSGTPQRQAARHAVHSTALMGSYPRVLDIGCGLGSFLEYLIEHDRPCTYTGYDLVSEYVAECRRLYPMAHFEQRNFLDQGIDGTYGTIVMSQVLNNRYERSSNIEVLEYALAIAFKHSTDSISVDMMSAYVDFRNPDLYYYQPEQVFAIAKALCGRVILRHDYRPFEFCIQLFHDGVGVYQP